MERSPRHGRRRDRRRGRGQRACPASWVAMHLVRKRSTDQGQGRLEGRSWAEQGARRFSRGYMSAAARERHAVTRGTAGPARPPASVVSLSSRWAYEEMVAIHELDGKDSHVPNSPRHCHRCWPHTPGREAKSRPSVAPFNGASRLAEN